MTSSRLNNSIPVIVMGILVAIVLALLFIKTDQVDVAPSNVKLVSAIMRHGDRTPTDTYPNDPYKDYDWPDGWGALTKIGKNQLYKMGSRLRNRYQHVLKEIYSPNDIYVQSSDNDRCHMSAAVALASLYPPKEFQIWNDKLLWQPIPIHSLPRNLDQTLAMKKPCAKYDKELAAAYHSPEIRKIDDQNADLYEYVSHHAGKNYTTITDIEFLHTTLEIEEAYGLKLPEWTVKVYPNRTLPLMKQSLAIFSYSQFMKRIRGGSFIKEVINNMIEKRNGQLKPDRTMFLYSAHDITLVHIFRTLGFEELMKPAYGATLIFELHETVNQPDMELKLMYFNNTEQENPIELKIPKCGPPCELNAFVQLMTPLIPGDFDEECQQQ